MAFATVEDLATYLQRDLSAADSATADQALDLATGYIQTRTGQDIAEASETVTLYPERWSELLALPQVPVTAVTAVTVAGVTFTSFSWRSNGLIYRMDGGWWGDWRQAGVVDVTYTHGYATIPDDIRRLCLKSAALLMDNARDVVSESVGNASVTYGRLDTDLSADDQRTIAAYGVLAVA